MKNNQSHVANFLYTDRRKEASYNNRDNDEYSDVRHDANHTVASHVFYFTSCYKNEEIKLHKEGIVMKASFASNRYTTTFIVRVEHGWNILKCMTLNKNFIISKLLHKWTQSQK